MDTNIIIDIQVLHISIFIIVLILFNRESKDQVDEYVKL